MDLATILRDAIRQGASDIHMVAGAPVMLRVQGELLPMGKIPPMDPKILATMINSVLSDTNREHFEKELSVDISFGVDTFRFRGSIALQRHGIEAVFRVIPNYIPSPEELMLPPAIIKCTELKRGLVLVTGPTGAGKSTTLASLVERINQIRRAKVITLEDPIEFIHTNRKSLISQREIGQHSPNLVNAMQSLLRQDPDVVLVGEMRDYETIAAAIQVADTGHLVLATMHSVDAPQAVERIIDVFPGHQQQQVRSQMSAILRAVVAQTLVPRLDGRGRVAAFEVMVVNPAVATMIRQGRTHEIYSVIEMGSMEGMVSLTRSFQDLVRKKVIDPSAIPANLTSPVNPADIE